MLAKHDVDLVVDVGAADGGWPIAPEFGYTGPIVSFEPLSASFASLSTAVQDDPTWSAHHLALGTEPGSATINIASNSASS